jgi:hypothetical protein
MRGFPIKKNNSNDVFICIHVLTRRKTREDIYNDVKKVTVSSSSQAELLLLLLSSREEEFIRKKF